MRTSYTRSWRARLLICVATFGILIFLGALSGVLAQSTDRDNPTPLVSNEIRGYGIGRKVEYYYTFLAGPGEVAITIDSGAKASFSEMDAELFDLDAQRLAQLQNLPYPGETSRIVKRVSFGAQQPVLLRIFLDRDAAQYLIRVGGALQLAGADASFSGSAAGSVGTITAGTVNHTYSAATDTASSRPLTPDPPSIQPVDQPVAPMTGTSPQTNAAIAPGTSVTGATSGQKRLWVKLNSAGELLGMAGVGAIHIEMKDGTAHDIRLDTIRRVLIGESSGTPADGSTVTPSGEDKLSGWQRLWLKLGAGGDLAGLNGRSLRLEMKDGKIQEISPARVKKVSLKSGK